MHYNTQQAPLPLPEYGRSIQNMVDYALTLADREERNRCARTIIRIMGTMFPQLRDASEQNHKLWDHLIIMSGFRLDVDCPCEVVRKEELSVRPEPLPYPSKHVRCRHYGRYVQSLLDRVASMPDGPQKASYLYLIACTMKRDYLNWNKDSVEDRKIFADIREFTDGAITILERDMRLPDNFKNATLPYVPGQRKQKPYNRNYRQYRFGKQYKNYGK